MLKRAFRFIITFCGMLFGFGVSQTIFENFPEIADGAGPVVIILFYGTMMFIFGIIFFSFSTFLNQHGELIGSNAISDAIKSVPIEELIPGILGLILGAVVASLFSNLILGIESLDVFYINIILSIFLTVGLAYYGWLYGRRIGQLVRAGGFSFSNLIATNALKRRTKTPSGAKPKILDTSVIIDGRIQELMKTGFLEGDVIIPDFVLVELRHICDSSNDLKRNRGRRGVDILQSIQDEYGIDIYKTSDNPQLAKIEEVDMKLLKLASILDGAVVTNDYNLNKVATVEGIRILNINELANTLKPLALPGELMRVTPIKGGKANDQSVAYLDDGTMVVVQNGRDLIGQTIDAVVTSVLQTSAGRMIFVRPQ